VKLTHGLARLLLLETAEARKTLVDQLLREDKLPYGQQQTKSSSRKPKDVALTLFDQIKKKSKKHQHAVLKELAVLLGLEVVEKSTGT
jgi:hypothetical protein